MKLKALDFLACPICNRDFELRDSSFVTPVASAEASPVTGCVTCHAPAAQRAVRAQGQPCAACYAQEIVAGVLVCAQGHTFRIADGVPRLRLDQKLDKAPARANDDALSVAASFGAEWSHFDYAERTWSQNVEERCELFLKELATTPEKLRGKVVLDAGCGNGSLSRGVNQFGCEVLAIDVSPSVEVAFKHFAAKGNDRTHFVQGDLMNPPLKRHVFDVIYSTGVLHHNPNTREALGAIAKSLKPGGRIYIWVYGHEPGVVHKLKELFRRTISPLPSSVKHTIVVLWLPQAMLRQYLRTALGRNAAADRLTWRERLILLLDHYTPRWRWEHTPEEVKGWYRELGYEQIEQTEDREWGFGVAASNPREQAATSSNIMPALQ
jgi:2-polyprenyl-3-methyl-5-hydroxy-6-metoxy-1,4-benzoquinol methylase